MVATVAKLITVQEAAEILRLHPRTVMNMAKRGELPGSKIGKQWRFDLEAVESWLENQFRKSVIEETEEAARVIPVDVGPVVDLLAGERVRCVETLGTKVEVLETLSALLAHAVPGMSFETVYQALSQREEMHPTALAGGVAFPHPRRPLSNVPGPLLAGLLVRSGVDFGAPDGEPTYFFVCICGPDDPTHVSLLAKLAHLFRKDDVVSGLREAEDAAGILRELRRLESSTGPGPDERKNP